MKQHNENCPWKVGKCNCKPKEKECDHIWMADEWIDSGYKGRDSQVIIAVRCSKCLIRKELE